MLYPLITKKMKKIFYFSLILGSFLVISNSKGQELPPNTYGGRCCQMILFSCDHPIGLKFADSIWVSGDSCPSQVPIPVFN